MWESYSFKDATLQVASGKILGRDLEACGADVQNNADPSSPAPVQLSGARDTPAMTALASSRDRINNTVAPAPAPSAVSSQTHVPLAANHLCFGIHLSAKHTPSDTDVAYGLLEVCKPQVTSTDETVSDSVASDINHSNVALTCQNKTSSTLPFLATGFSAQLPPSTPARIRVGLAAINVNDFKVETVTVQPTLTDLGERINYLGCDHLSVEGSASFAAINVPSSLPLNASEAADLGVSSLGAFSQGDPAESPFTATPSLMFGQNCSIFSMQGFLPLRITPQSLIIITSLVFIASKDYDGRDLFYFNAAGSFTSGNVTAVLSSVGFRTLAGRQVGNKTDRCLKAYHETMYGHLCVVSDINWPLSAGITAGQNANQIIQALTGLGGLILGVAVKH